MGARTEQYAKQLEEANAELIAMVESCPDSKWNARTGPEGWPVNVLAHHIASGHSGISGMALAVANGQPLRPFTPEMLHAMNAKHAEEQANCTKAETLALLREGGAAAARAVRGLGDEQ